MFRSSQSFSREICFMENEHKFSFIVLRGFSRVVKEDTGGDTEEKNRNIGGEWKILGKINNQFEVKGKILSKGQNYGEN